MTTPIHNYDIALVLAEEQGLFKAINALRAASDIYNLENRVRKAYGGVSQAVSDALIGMAQRAIAAGKSYDGAALNYAVAASDVPISGHIPETEYHTHVGVELLPGGLGLPVWKSFTIDTASPPTEKEILDKLNQELKQWIKDYFFGITPDVGDVQVMSVVKGEDA